MKDLIDRQAAIDLFKDDDGNGNWTYNVTIQAALKALPSAERTGRWTHVYDENAKLFFRNKWVCSACGKSNTYGMAEFCPDCGARMENSTRRMKEAKE